MWVSSVDLEDPLEKNMAAHASVLTWRILWTEERGRLWSIGLQRVLTQQKQLSIQHGQRLPFYTKNKCHE